MTPDLLTCRLVNRDFNGIASATLRDRPTNQLTFHYNSFLNVYVQTLALPSPYPSYKIWSSRRSLEKLRENCDNSFDFPFANFDFDKVHKLGSSSMTKFLTTVGPHIESLELDFSYKKDLESVRALRKFLVDQAPNVQHLKIRYQSPPERSSLIPLFEGEEVKNFIFSLKSIDISECEGHYPQFVVDILMKSPQLKVIKGSWEDGLQCKDLKLLRLTHKIHLMKKVKIDVHIDLLIYWARFADDDLQLQNLFLSADGCAQNQRYWTRCNRFITQILKSSKANLNVLSLKSVPFCENLEFPILEKVRKLYLTAVNDPIFPYGKNLSKHFPKLEEIGKLFYIFS